MAQAIRSFANTPYAALGANLVVTAPAGVQNGDLLLIALLTEGTTSFATLAGWTASYANIAANATIQTFYKLASGEPASWTWSCPSTRACAKVICISGASDVIDASSFKQNSNINTLLGTDITTTAPNEVLIWVASRPNVASGGAIQLPTNITTGSGGNVNAGGTTITAQMGMGAAIFPSAGITNGTWSAGSLGGGITANSSVALWTFKDAVVGGQPLMFCEA